MMYRRWHEESPQESVKYLPMKRRMYFYYVKKLYRKIDKERKKQVIAGNVTEHRTETIYKQYQEFAWECNDTTLWSE